MKLPVSAMVGKLILTYHLCLELSSGLLHFLLNHVHISTCELV
jgi:hypothetical protein